MRVLLASVLALGLALGQGLVLPFRGQEGFRLAQAFAEGLKAPPPTLLALLLPDPPWRGGYDLAGGLYSPGGARLVREITGADWVLLGAEERGGLRLHLATGEGVRTGSFSSPRLAWLWLQGLGLAPPYTPLPSPKGEEARLRALAQGEDPDPLHQSALDLKAGRGAGLLEGLLPSRLLLLWQGKPPRAFQALGLLALGRKEEALKAAASLEEEGALGGIAALLLYRLAENPRWQTLAPLLAQRYPEIPYFFEEASFAAFEKGQGEEAKRALERALSLRPDYWLYWTNLGWALYLTGDLPRAIRATEKALALQPNATALYNLGLFRAIYGDYLGAKAAYDRALRLDQGDEYEAALKDLEERREPLTLFFRAYLAQRVGLEAAPLYRAFLEAHPRHPLAGRAREALRSLAEKRVTLKVHRLVLIPGDREARPFRVGEAIFPEVRLEGTPYLGKGVLTTLLYREGEKVAEASKEVSPPPLAAGLEEVAPPVTPKGEGPHTLVVRYGEAEAVLPLEIGKKSLARSLYALGLQPKDLSGRPLLTPEEALGPEGEALLLERTAEAFRRAAPLATGLELNRPLPKGPFPGKSVREALAGADLETARTFYQKVEESPELLGDQDVVNAFANWLLAEGRP